MGSRTLGGLVVVALATLGAAPARAEVIELLDRTKISGKIVHYYDGVYSIEAAGATTKIPREKIKSISFQLPPPRAEFSSAEKTFDRWKTALTKGDLETAIDCYALMYQGMLASQVGHASDGIKQMQKEIAGTSFVIKGSQVKGDTATLKVQRKKGDESDTGDIAFVRENGEWKMLPPQ